MIPRKVKINITDTRVSSGNESNETEGIDEPNETVRSNECTNEELSSLERPIETHRDRCNFNMRGLNPEISSSLPVDQYLNQPNTVDTTMNMPNMPIRQLSLPGVSENDECQI